MTQELLADGIYFNLDENRYHAERRLSASGIKEILISLPTYWAKSWMNPDREEADANTLAKTLGSAYHTAVFEPHLLDKRFISDLDPEDYPDALTTDTQVSDMLGELGQTKKKAGEKALDRARRLAEIDPSVQILSLLQEDFDQSANGRAVIKPRYWKQIQRDILRIKDNPEVHDVVTGGAAEVSVLWTCPESGIPMKCRFDMLKAESYVDMKSFANSNGKPVNQFISDQIRYNRYYIQMRLYQVAADMIRELDLKIQDAPTDEQLENSDSFPPARHQALIEGIKARRAPHEVYYFFQEKNGIPNLLLRRIRMFDLPAGVDAQEIGAEAHEIKQARTGLAVKADMEIQRAKMLYRDAMAVYGEDQPWYPFDMIGEITDDHFSRFWLDGE